MLTFNTAQERVAMRRRDPPRAAGSAFPVPAAQRCNSRAARVMFPTSTTLAKYRSWRRFQSRTHVAQMRSRRSIDDPVDAKLRLRLTQVLEETPPAAKKHGRQGDF